MSIQSSWVGYRHHALMDFGGQLTDDYLGLLRHAFFCGAAVTYEDVLSSAKAGTAEAMMLAIRDELAGFMEERHGDNSVSVH